jgi:hypothetical protein
METEPLPLENELLIELSKTDEGKKALSFIMSLNTYRDHETWSKFYYSSTFRVSPNPAGAATVLTNDAAVSRRSEIDRISSELSLLKTEDFLAIRAAYNNLTKKLGTSKLTQAERDAINIARAALKAELDQLKAEATANEGELPAYVLNAKNERMADLFGLSGIPITLAEVSNVGERAKKLGILGASNGGFLSGNVFAGFTPEQIEYLRLYKEKRAQLGFFNVRLVVLPVNSIEFFSLAETYTNSKDKETVGIPLFRSMQGSGSASAGTFNFDLTLDGAEKFKIAPPPVVVPVGIKATLTVRPPRFIARLSCDFSTGWSVQGRTDIKDGLVIYNDDIYSTMVAKSVGETNKPCQLYVKGGTGNEREFAYTTALHTLQERFQDLYFERVSLSKQEKDKYWTGVQEDIAAHRHTGANEGWSGLFGIARGLGFVGTIIGGFGNASRFYWHTNKQNIQSLDRVKFEEEIIIDQNQTYTMDLGTADMCLAWNPNLSRYLACTPEESRTGQSVHDAYDEATESDSCDEGMTAIECGEQRNENAETNENGNIAAEDPPPPSPEVSLPDEI